MQDFDFEIQSAQERRRMAQALRNQGFQMPEAQMVGGRYIAPGIDQVLVQALKQYGATKEEKAAENQIRALNQQRAEKMQSALDEFLIKSQGRPAEVLPPDIAGPPRPAEPQDMPGAYKALMGAPDAGYRQAGFTGAANFAQQQAEQQRKAQENQRLMSILQSSTPQQAIAAGVPVETVKSYYESRNFGRDKVQFKDVGGQLVPVTEFGDIPANVTPLQKTGDPFKDMLVRGASGELVPNQPLVQAKGTVARAGRSMVTVNNKGPEAFDVE
jgi:hypothetical protein